MVLLLYMEVSCSSQSIPHWEFSGRYTVQISMIKIQKCASISSILSDMALFIITPVLYSAIMAIFV